MITVKDKITKCLILGLRQSDDMKPSGTIRSQNWIARESLSSSSIINLAQLQYHYELLNNVQIAEDSFYYQWAEIREGAIDNLTHGNTERESHQLKRDSQINSVNPLIYMAPRAGRCWTLGEQPKILMDHDRRLQRAACCLHDYLNFTRTYFSPG